MGGPLVLKNFFEGIWRDFCLKVGGGGRESYVGELRKNIAKEEDSTLKN